MPWMHPTSGGIIELRADIKGSRRQQFYRIVDGEVLGCTKGETIRLPIKWVNAHMTNLSTETTKEQRT